METFSIPTEADIKKWIFEAIEACLGNKNKPTALGIDEPLLTRQEAAGILKISLATLSDWTKRGLPHYRQRGRVYFIKRELLEYLRTQFPDRLKFSDKYADFNKSD